VLRSSAETGLYGAAAVIILALPVAATSLVSSLYPALSRCSGPADPELGRIFRVAAGPLFGAGLCTAAALSVMAPWVIRLGFGQRFAPAAPMLAALAWVLPVRFVNVLCGTTLNATDRQRRRAVAVGAGALLNLLANIALIPIFGAWGAVWSSLITESVLFVLLLWALHPLRPPVVRPILQGGGIALLTVLTLAAVPGHAVTRTAAGLFVSGTLALAAWGRPLRTLESSVT
jgi:O-antigen/teichoic acid export membrane protein